MVLSALRKNKLFCSKMNSMKRLFTYMILSVITATAYSQAKIESVGFSTITVKPDIGVLTLNFSIIKADIGSAVENLNTETNRTTEQLGRLVMENMSQSTQNFSVRVNRIFNNTGRFKDSGYVASQQVRVSFKNSKENISKVLSSFSEDYGDLHFNFSFEASDSLKRSVENRIVKLATQDAIEKAEILAGSAKRPLGRIIEIKHGNIPFQGASQMGTSGGLNEVIIRGDASGFEANDLKFSDRVLIIFEMK
jgi:uncharacterized protein YggE